MKEIDDAIIIDGQRYQRRKMGLMLGYIQTKASGRYEATTGCETTMSDVIERAEACINKRFDKDTVAELFPMLLAECKRLEDVLVGTTRGIEDARYECRRAMAEAARWQAAFQPGDERCLKAVIGLVRGVLGPETVSDELSCLLRLQKAALGCQQQLDAEGKL